MIALSPYRGKTLAVLGLGKSGLATIEAALAGGARVVAWDDGAERREGLKGVEIAAPEAIDWSTVALLAAAPGVPLTHPAPHPAVSAAFAHGVEVVGDIELFLRVQPSAKVVGITGTNGKSTTTALVGHILEAAGRPVIVAGNIGRPVLELDPAGPETIHVFELSSYQLDLTPSIKPAVGVLLNITPDHLDRHGDMAGYVRAKARLFERMTAGDVAVIGVDDEHGVAIADRLGREGGQNVVPIAVGRPVSGGVYVIGGQLFDNGLRVMELGTAPALPGEHNQQNAAAAYATCRALGLRPGTIADGIRSFPGLPHRIERIAERGGVTYYNDSKATNPEAAARALAAFPRIYWIAGGKPKTGGLDAVLPYLGHVVRAYLIGEAADRFGKELAGRTNCVQCGTLQAALEAAAQDAEAGGGVVLLSPACASFDQFANFEARGDAFRAAVLARLGERPAGGAA